MLISLVERDFQPLKKAALGALTGCIGGTFLGLLLHGLDFSGVMLTTIIAILFGVVFGASYNVPTSFQFVDEDDAEQERLTK